ncbi:DUF305 domain-containing protein [Streptomyces turgidiscabies]|uniref:Uncharacterized protein (DUF305 family) n=1 Tax=Streptomyces turgidiscabies TaxID=85558 RepID=A0ABU0RDS4_9ACTN|nr:DUF305 domain-containing protein [Streptomyces turgidiscabies]MDQ0930143.1 uncharacterized protein (DUF305 family) [Streptomyces turgidiscabies]
MRTIRKTFVALTATAALALTLTACGSDDGNSDNNSSNSGASNSSSKETKATGDHNAQDVTFAQGMIPHHQGALVMAKAAADKASSAEVKSLAARIEKAQAPEIETMTGWLKTWGKDVPASAESMPGMESMESMPGMDHAASGKQFDKNFLTMMIEHHKGAVTMATTEKAKGEYGPATSMADDVIRTQTAEIAEMNKLLGKS